MCAGDKVNAGEKIDLRNGSVFILDGLKGLRICPDAGQYAIKKTL